MQFFVEPIWSWPLVVITGVGLLVLVLLTYQAQTKRLSKNTRTLLTLRLLSALILIFAMFRPALQKTDTDDNPVQLIVLADVSRSMNTKDMPGGESRFKAVRDDLAKYQPKWKEMGKQVKVREFDFDRDLMPRDLRLPEGIGDQTAIGKVLEDLLRDVRDHRSLGVLLFTDGAQRAVPPFDVDPFAAARKLGDNQLPIYTIGYGASSLSTASLDFSVEDIRLDPVVFEKKLVPISCKIRALGAKGKKARVRVLVEDRTGKRINESGTLKPVPSTLQAKTVQELDIQKDTETIVVDLSFVPMMPGELKVAVEIESNETEPLMRNNRRETIVSVKKGGLNVAYFDQLRPETNRIRMVNGADKIQLDFQEIRSNKTTGGQPALDQSWFHKGRYDVYIIGDVRADWIGSDNLKLLNSRLEDGAGLMMIGGLQNFAAGGYALTPLVDWLPVELDSSEFQPEGRPNAAAQIVGDVKMIPTDAGLRSFVMQLGPREANRGFWTGLPPLSGANRLHPRNDLVRIWAETADRQPLLLVNEVGRSRVAAFAGDTTWLWVSDNQAELHQRFWRQMILWLARKEADTDQPVWVKVEPRNYMPGATASLTFGARGADGTPINDIDFQVEVTKPDNRREKVTPRHSNGEYSADFSATADPGDYWVRVTAKKNGDAYTRFIVDARDLELDYPTADYDFLKELSALSGGSSIKPEELGSLIDRLKQTKMNALTRIQVISLWDNWWLLTIFVGLMSLEWYLRKKRGLV